MKKLFLGFVGIILFGIVGVANATMVQANFDYTGEITSISNDSPTNVTIVNDYLSVGDHFSITGNFSYDDSLDPSLLVNYINTSSPWAELNYMILVNGYSVYNFDQGMNLKPLTGEFLDQIPVGSLVDLIMVDEINVTDSMLSMLCLFPPDSSYIQGEITSRNISYLPVPEPATGMLFGLGLLGIAGFRRRKQ